MINLLAEPKIRAMYVKLRAFVLIKLLRRLKTIDSENAFKVTVKHNVNGILQVNNRMNLLLYPVSIIESVPKNARILVIGPRNENDIYSLIGLGFNKKNIMGCDLISYSNKIVLGDMHALPFNNNEFDVVICGWTLSYSATPAKAADEMKRVLKPGGILAIGVEYSTLTSDDAKKVEKGGYSIQEFDRLAERVNSVDAIKQLIGAELDHVYFSHDAPNKISHTAEGVATNVSNVALVASIKK